MPNVGCILEQQLPVFYETAIHVSMTGHNNKALFAILTYNNERVKLLT
jgi:hypothetical protein